ncbi:hypothetical protein MRBLMF1_008088 [Streptomyces ossamyceticus]
MREEADVTVRTWRPPHREGSWPHTVTHTARPQRSLQSPALGARSYGKFLP